MFFKSKKVLGLDIGTSSIKVAELDLTRSGASLVSFGFSPTPQGAINGGEISDPSGIAAVLQSIINEVKCKRKNVSTGMWGTSVIVKKITIPRIEEKFVAEQIRFEAEQYIPFDINDISLAYHILKSTGSADTMDVLLIAAQNELVLQYGEVVSMAGLNIAVMDVSSFALANCFELNYGKQAGQSVGLLNIGAGITNFVVLHDGEVVFSRDIPVGGANFTNEIHKELGVTTPEAESLKLSASAGREVPDEVHSIISATSETLTEELRNSFDFFSATTAGLNLTHCFYCGGGSLMGGLMDKVSKMSNLQMEPLNPFLKIKSSSKAYNESYMQQIAPFSAVVMGLALRQLGDK